MLRVGRARDCDSASSNRRSSGCGRAAQLESNNHWYQFFLAYLEDQANAKDQALSHYTAALALRPQSPWVRFSRAKIYRATGQWDFALEDMETALETAQSDRPEAAQGSSRDGLSPL